MAGPSYTGVKTVIDPFEGLQKAVSNAGDIYREYEKSSREADVHNAKMQEVERVKHQRDFLKNYDPQFGVQGRGLTDDAKRFAQEEEERIVQHFAEASARGEEVPSPEELRKQISATYGQLATQESAQQVIVRDLIAQGFEPDAAATYAQSLTGGLVSRASLQDQEKARADAIREHKKEIREAGDKSLQRQAEMIKARAAVLSAENSARNGDRRYTSGTKPAARGTWQETKEFKEGLDDAIAGWPINVDGTAALDVIHRGLDAYNAERRAANKPELPKSEAYNYAYESIGRDWLVGRDIEAQTPGEFQVLLKEKFDDNPDAFRRGYGGGGAGGAGGTGSSVLTELDRNSANMLRDVVLVQPRSMTEIEKARVQEAFKGYIPRPQTASTEAGSTTTTASAGDSTTTTAPQGGTGTTSGKKGGAETATEAEKRRDELLAKQEEVKRRAEQEADEKAAAEAARAASNRSFLGDTSLPVEERVRMLRDNEEASDKVQREEVIKNLTLDRDQVLADLKKHDEYVEERRLREESSGRPYNPVMTSHLVDERAKLSSKLHRLNREMSEVENQTVDPNRPIEELLPRGVYNLEDGAGVSPRAAEIARGILVEYEDTLYEEVPRPTGRSTYSTFGGVSDSATTNARRQNAPNVLLNKVEQTANNIAAVDPALAEEVRKAAIFGKEQVDGRRTLMYNLQDEHRKLGVAEEDLVNRRSVETVPEAVAGLDRLIESVRKLQAYLNLR